MALILLFQGQWPRVDRAEKKINSFGEQSQAPVLMPIGSGLEKKVTGALSEGQLQAQAVRTGLSPGDVSGFFAVDLSMPLRDPVASTHAVLVGLSNSKIVQPVVSYEILLDGRKIKSQVTRAAVVSDEDAVHNSVEIRSTDTNLFQVSDPDVNSGTSRIQVDVGGRSILFLLEERSGTEKAFVLWGRSISAMDDSPYVDDIDFSLSAPELASSVAAGLLVANSLVWEAVDWVLPASFEFSGSPIEGISRIAKAVGAVVRSNDDGTIRVRPRFPVRPIDMPTTVPDVNYDRENLIRLNFSEEKGKRYNSVEVLGATADVFVPDHEIEPTVPGISEDVIARVYWAGRPKEALSRFITAGLIVPLGEFFGSETEVINFLKGVGRVAKPVTSLTSIEWIGIAGGTGTVEQFSKEIVISNSAYRVGRVRYTTTYQKYRLYNHNVIQLLSVLVLGTENDVSVLVITETGTEEAPGITSDLLTDQNSARARGTAYLDDNKYDRQKLVLESPYNDSTLDGNLAYVNDGLIEVIGNYHIKRAAINFDGPKVVNMIEVVKCLV